MFKFVSFALLAFFALTFFACNPTEYEPRIVLGREYNATAQVVADTTSKFRLNDVVVVQMDNGNKPFHAEKVELRIYQGETDRILFRYSILVKNIDAKATLTMPNLRKKIPTPGIYRVAFAIGDSIMLERNMELMK